MLKSIGARRLDATPSPSSLSPQASKQATPQSPADLKLDAQGSVCQYFIIDKEESAFRSTLEFSPNVTGSVGLVVVRPAARAYHVTASVGHVVSRWSDSSWHVLRVGVT